MNSYVLNPSSFAQLLPHGHRGSLPHLGGDLQGVGEALHDGKAHAAPLTCGIGGVKGLAGFPHVRDAAALVLDLDLDGAARQNGDSNSNAPRIGGIAVAVDDGVGDRLGDGALDVGDLGDPGVQLGHKGRHRRPRHGLVHRQGGELDLDLIEDLPRKLGGSTGAAHAFFSFLGSVS